MITVASFKDILISKSGGKPLGKVSNFYSILFQAMAKVKSHVDLPSALRCAQLTNPIYTDKSRYPLPSDVGQNAIVTLRPITPDDTYYDFRNLNSRQLRNEEKFNQSSQRYGVRNLNGVQYLVIQDETTTPYIIASGDSLTDPATVSLVGVSTLLELDYLQKTAGSASMSFTAGIGTSNGIKGIIPAAKALDLTTQKDILVSVYLPTITNVTGIKINLGQSAAAYYAGASALDFFGNALKVGWNLIRVPKTAFAAGAGVPTWSNIQYWEVDVLGTLAVATAGFKVDALEGQIGAIFEIDYYSDFQFLDITGARIQKPTADTDNILISGDEIDLFTDQFIEIMTIDLKQQGATVDYQTYGGTKLLTRYADFQFKHPSLRQLMTTTYGSHPAGRINS